MGSSYSRIFPPKSLYSTDQMPDLNGKVAIVTGGNTGIGKETVKALLEHGATVYLAARSAAKAQAAIDDLYAATGKRAIFLSLDLGNLDSIKKSAQEFLLKESALHIIFNNAGVMIPPVELITDDGYDLQFGTNVLGHFYFNKLLLPLLVATAMKDGIPSRVIVTSSSVSTMADKSIPIDFATLKEKDGSERRKKGTIALYAQSKFANVLYAKGLASRYDKEHIISISLDPGNIKTDLQRYVPSFFRAIIHLFLYPPSMGALTQLYAGTSPEALKLNGQYLVPWARIGKPHPRADDTDLGEKLWEWLELQVAHR